jgi:Protein of unknown function (DUF3024)
MQPLDVAATHAILYQYTEEQRPPEDIRPQLDIGYTFEGQEVFLNEIRPDWQDESIIRHYPFAKLKFTKSQQVWKLYWHRASGKWEAYEPFAESASLQELLDCVAQDSYGCFHG